MKRMLGFIGLLWCLVWAALGVYGACPLPNINNPNAVTVQGPGPDGGYPLPVTTNTGCPLDVNVLSGGGGGCVTQCTTPWIVAGTKTPGQGFVTPADAVGVQSFGQVWNGATWDRTAGFVYPSAFPGGIARPTTTVQAVAALPTVLNENTDKLFSLLTSPGGAGGLARYDGTLAAGMCISTGSYNSCVTSPVEMNGDTGGGGNAGIGWHSVPCVQWAKVGAVGPSGNTWSTGFAAIRTPDSFKTVATAAAGNTALWTPAAGKRFRLMRYMVEVTGDVSQAVPGIVTISLFDGAAGVTNQVQSVFVPAVALNTVSMYTSPWIDLGNGYLSAAANNVLNINLSAALTAGTVRVQVAGTEE